MKFASQVPNLIPLEEKIAKTQRLLRRLEEDQPYLQARLSVLGAEYRQSSNAFAERVRAEAEAELQRLLAERGLSSDCLSPMAEPEGPRRTGT
jgi:hypothetical protein